MRAANKKLDLFCTAEGSGPGDRSAFCMGGGYRALDALSWRLALPAQAVSPWNTSLTAQPWK